MARTLEPQEQEEERQIWHALRQVEKRITLCREAADVLTCRIGSILQPILDDERTPSEAERNPCSEVATELYKYEARLDRLHEQIIELTHRSEV